MAKFRSNLEKQFSKVLEDLNIPVDFEPDKLSYTVTHNYIPDFKIYNDTYVETKGWLKAADRKKLLKVKEAHPNIKIILIFMKPNNKLSKTSKVTYWEWATKNDFMWAEYGDTRRLRLILNQVKVIKGKD